MSEWASLLGVSTVPVLYRGIWDEDAVRECFTGVSRCGGDQEGYVVRLAGKFHLARQKYSIAKFVRPGHVQTDEHWMSGAIIPNRMVSLER